MLKIGQIISGQTRDEGITNKNNREMGITLYQGWEEGYQEYSLPPFSRLMLIEKGCAHYCARLKVVSLARMAANEDNL